MKKLKESIFIMVVLITTLGFGQNQFTNSEVGRLTIGLEGGLGRRTLRGNDLIDDQDPALGFEGGLSFQYNINDKLSIKSNLFFARKGNSFDFVFKEDLSDMGKEETIVSNYDFLTLPVKFHKVVLVYLNSILC